MNLIINGIDFNKVLDVERDYLHMEINAKFKHYQEFFMAKEYGILPIKKPKHAPILVNMNHLR